MDIKKILGLVDSIEITNPKMILAENNNRLSAAEQLVMQHYPSVKKKKPSIIGPYVKCAEKEQLAAQALKNEAYAQKARMISEKLMNQYSPYTPSKTASRINSDNTANTISEDEIDTVTLDIPLLMRIMEYSKEDAETDMDLHHAAEKMIGLSKQFNKLSMEHYEAIIGNQKSLPDKTY
jgi:hypothetical protein